MTFNEWKKQVKGTTPESATHFDTFWHCFLKEDGRDLMFFEGGGWQISAHKDGVAHLSSVEVEKL